MTMVTLGLGLKHITNKVYLSIMCSGDVYNHIFPRQGFRIPIVHGTMYTYLCNWFGHVCCLSISMIIHKEKKVRQQCCSINASVSCLNSAICQNMFV